MAQSSTTEPRSKAARKYRELYLTASAASVGLELALAVVVGWAVGYWLDGRFGTDPWLMLLFLCFGIAAGFKGVIRVARQANRAAEESDE